MADEKEKMKLIPFSKELEEAIEADAKRSHRQFVRQVVAVLMAYYDLENTDINHERLKMLTHPQMIGEIMPKSDTSIPVLTTKKNKERKAS